MKKSYCLNQLYCYWYLIGSNVSSTVPTKKPCCHVQSCLDANGLFRAELNLIEWITVRTNKVNEMTQCQPCVINDMLPHCSSLAAMEVVESSF